MAFFMSVSTPKICFIIGIGITWLLFSFQIKGPALIFIGSFIKWNQGDRANTSK